jgi:hypothetical protein
MNARNALLTTTLVAALAGCGQAPNAAYLPSSGSPAGADASIAAVRPAGARALRIYFAGYDASQLPFGASEIGVYAASATGNAGALDVIKGSNTLLDSPEIAIPDHSGRIWTCNFNDDNVEAFAPGASGNAAPVVNITGSKVPLNACGGMALGKTGSIYATSFGSVPNGAPPALLVWPSGSNGNAGPHEAYSGSKTGFAEPSGVALDAAGRIYVGNASKIAIFGSASGNVAPTYTISGAATGLQYPAALAIDPATQHLLAADEASNAIYVFAAGAHGNVAPIAKIAGSKTLLDNPYGVAIDPAGYIYVGNCPQKAPDVGSIEVFAPNAKGNVKPVQRIAGSNAYFTCVVGLTVL